MPFSAEALRTLGLSPCDLENLTEEQQKMKIRKQWSNLCLRYHPDKNPGHVAEFDDVMTAYKTLTKVEENYQHEIEDFLTPEVINIPYHAFDLTQQEGILTSYDHLLLDFSRLRTPSAKKAFATHYAPFLSLGRSLGTQQDVINQKRVDSLLRQMQETLAQRLKREWRILILRLFAEEFLDDFQYRQALATGNLYPILATAKLLSPIKLLVAVINSLILVACCSANYVYQDVLQHIVNDFIRQYGSPQNSTLREKLLLAVKILVLTGVLALPAYVAPVWTCYAFALPLIARLLELLASPVNQGIRPLATRLNCSPILLTAMTLVTGTLMLVMGFIHANTFASSLLIIAPWVFLILNVYMVYNCIQLIRKLYELMPSLAIFQIIILVPPPVPSSTAVNIFGELLMLLSICSLLEIANYQLENLSATAAEMIEKLPLPEEGPIGVSLQEASLLGYKTATWSHRLFNTPKDAEYIRAEERTSQQQWASFFGGGAKQAGALPRFEDDIRADNRLLINAA
ncbi:MAG: DnaJ domain-containing protein [Legionellales bacterium]|nr:DnaJ domain-containing protein [Legionellales bacterium]